MPLQYVDVELQEKLKEMAEQEKQTVVAVLRRLVGIGAKKNTVPVVAPVAPTPVQVLDDPNARWENTKEQLGKKCGCEFDDNMDILSVKDWGLFRTINNGKLMEKYLSMHPEERDKYAVVVTEANK